MDNKQCLECGTDLKENESGTIVCPYCGWIPTIDDLMAKVKASQDCMELYDDHRERIESALAIANSYLDNKWFPHTSPDGVDRKAAIKAIKKVL